MDLRVWAFNSAIKMSNAQIENRDQGGGYKVYNKGASEWMLKNCS